MKLIAKLKCYEVIMYNYMHYTCTLVDSAHKVHASHLAWHTHTSTHMNKYNLALQQT